MNVRVSFISRVEPTLYNETWEEGFDNILMSMGESYLDGEKVLILVVRVIFPFILHSFTQRKEKVQVQMKTKNSQSRGSTTIFIVVFIRFYILFVKF